MGCASVVLEQVRNDSRLAPSSLLLGKARKRSLLSLNRKVVNFELFPSPRHSFQRLFFAPATGCRNESAGALNAVGARCYSWSSAPFSATSSNGGRLWCTATDVHPLNNNNRSLGQSVRCVQHLRAVRLAALSRVPLFLEGCVPVPPSFGRFCDGSTAFESRGGVGSGKRGRQNAGKGAKTPGCVKNFLRAMQKSASKIVQIENKSYFCSLKRL